jgi:hypothetical protein
VTLRLLKVLLLVPAAALLLGPAGSGGLSAQEAVVRVDENVRFEPQGVIVARLVAGTPVRIEERQGLWSRVTFEGTVWEASLQRRDGGSFDLVVSAEEGENLRDGPGGAIIGRLNPATLLNEVSRTPGWIRVRRTAWMWHASLETRGDGAAPATPTPARPPAAAPPAGAARTDWLRAGAPGVAVLATPDGDTLATARGATELQVLGREGNWARVRVEGWVWVPATEAPATGDGGVVLRDVSAADLTRDPERYRGRMVSLQLQFISIERAEAVRSDFLEGEPFLLARSVDAARTFVYVVIPRDQLTEMNRLQPLERIQVTARVRTGAAVLTGNPVLELVALERLR